jgi:nucleoid-associated protein YejK
LNINTRIAAFSYGGRKAMGLNFELERLAIHYVDIKSKQIRYATGEQDVEALDSAITSFFSELLAEVWNAPDTGAIESARFMGQSVTQQCVIDILAGKNDFFETSKTLAHQLYQKTHTNASPGLLAVVRFVNHGTTYVALLKIRYKDESFVRALGAALTQLQVEHVQNMLLKEIQKGAISPHPTKDDYDLKIVDKVAREEPAKYFRDFLGCKSKQSDTHQTKKLLHVIEKYGETKELPTKRERLPRIVKTLVEKGVDITTDGVIEAVLEHRVFGSSFDADDFRKHVEADLGPIDIPIGVFTDRSKTTKRKYSVTFSDPRYVGLTISGPHEIVEKIISIEGERVIFRIQTTKEGYKAEYG